MFFEKVLKSRKAQEAQVGEVPKAARGLLLGGLFVLVIMSVMLNSSQLFASEGGQGTAVSLDNLIEGLRAVARGDTNISVVESVSVSDDNYVIVFFDVQTPFAKDLCQSNEDIPKPEQCGNNLCICIYHQDEFDEAPVDCKKAENMTQRFEIYSEPESRFNANLGGVIDGDRHFAVIYGDCDGSGGEPLGIRDIVIEKPAQQTGRIRISDDACANQKFRGKGGKCTRIINGTVACGPGESLNNNNNSKCDNGYVCCI